MVAIDSRSHGFWLAWASNAPLWARAARHLIESSNIAEKWLALVALHQCLKLACQLTDGLGGAVPYCPEARHDCPIPPRDMRKLRDRLAGFRDEALHLHEKTEAGRGITVTVTAMPPETRISSSVGRTRARTDQITRAELEAVVDKLMPWFQGHWQRLVDEESRTRYDERGGDC